MPKGTGVESVGYLLQVLGRRFEDELVSRLKEHDIAFKHFLILVALAREEGGVSQRDIGSRLGYPEYKTSRLLDDLEAAKLVKRLPNPDSRRTTLVELMPAGREQARILPGIVRKTNATMLQGLSGEESQDLLRLLQKLHAVT